MQSLPPVQTFALYTPLPIYPPDKVAAHIMNVKPSLRHLDLGEGDYRWAPRTVIEQRHVEATLRRPAEEVVNFLEFEFAQTVAEHLPSVKTVFMQYGWDEDNLDDPDKTDRVFWLNEDQQWCRYHPEEFDDEEMSEGSEGGSERVEGDVEMTEGGESNGTTPEAGNLADAPEDNDPYTDWIQYWCEITD